MNQIVNQMSLLKSVKLVECTEDVQVSTNKLTVKTTWTIVLFHFVQKLQISKHV